MRATLRWAAPTVLFAFAVGCGQEPMTSTKGPSPAPTSGDATPALVGGTLVTLKVEGMI